MEVNLRIVHFVNVENIFFFCATVKGGGVTINHHLSVLSHINAMEPLIWWYTHSHYSMSTLTSNHHYEPSLTIHHRHDVLAGDGQLVGRQHAQATQAWLVMVFAFVGDV